MAEERNSPYLKFGNTVRWRYSELLLHSHHLTYPDLDLNQVGNVSESAFRHAQT